MNRADVLVELLRNMHHRQPIRSALIKQVATLTGNAELDCIIKLQIFMYNMPLKNDQLSKVYILGQLIEIIAAFVEMPQPAKRLAYLDRLEFIKYCEQNRKYKQLACKALGIYPRLPIDRLPKIMNYEADLAKNQDQIRRVGNPNWQLTRSILASWHDQKKQSLSYQQNLSYKILLSTDLLFQLCQNTIWNALWSKLYVWYIHQLLWDNKNQSCGLKNWHIISDVNVHLESMQNLCFASESTAIHRCILKLVLFIIKYFIFNQNNFYFKEAFELFSDVGTNQNRQLWPYLLINEFFCVLAEKQKFQIEVEKSRGLMETFKRQLSNDELAEQLKYFLGKLLNEQELIAYVRQKQISYWQYELDDMIVQNICLRELQEGTINEANAKNVLLHLKNVEFLTKILNRDYSLWQGRSEKSSIQQTRLKLLVRTLLQNKQQFANKLTSIIQEEKLEIVKGLQVFGQQWSSVQKVQEFGVNQQNLDLVLKFIAYDYKISAEFSNECKFPRQEKEFIWQMINQLTSYLHDCYDKLSLETVKKIKQIYYNKQFVIALKRLPGALRDLFWQRFSWVLLKDSSFVKNLLSIQPAFPLADPDASTDSKEGDIVTQ